MRGEGGVTGSQPMSTAVHRSPNKLWRSTATQYLTYVVFPFPSVLIIRNSIFILFFNFPATYSPPPPPICPPLLTFTIRIQPDMNCIVHMAQPRGHFLPRFKFSDLPILSLLLIVQLFFLFRTFSRICHQKKPEFIQLENKF